MGPFTAIAIYLTIWWTVLFGVLPLRSRSHAEEGVEVTDGGDPGAPVNPNIKKKFLTTTWVAAIVFAIFWTVIHFKLISLPPVARTY